MELPVCQELMECQEPRVKEATLALLAGQALRVIWALKGKMEWTVQRESLV